MAGGRHARFRHDALLVGITAVVGAAIFAPLTLGGEARSVRTFTIWPGNDARFANMDWSCHYQANFHNFSANVPPLVLCQPAGTARGPKIVVTRDTLRVIACPRPDHCTTILTRPRSH